MENINSHHGATPESEIALLREVKKQALAAIVAGEITEAGYTDFVAGCFHAAMLRQSIEAQKPAKSLQECKDEVIKKWNYKLSESAHWFTVWDHFAQDCRQKDRWDVFVEKSDQAAELYASEAVKELKAVIKEREKEIKALEVVIQEWEISFTKQKKVVIEANATIAEQKKEIDRLSKELDATHKYYSDQSGG